MAGKNSEKRKVKARGGKGQRLESQGSAQARLATNTPKRAVKSIKTTASSALRAGQKITRFASKTLSSLLSPLLSPLLSSFLQATGKSARSLAKSLRLTGKNRAEIFKLAHKRIEKTVSLIDKRIYKPLSHRLMRVVKLLHAKVQKRYGKTKFYINSAKRLALARKRFLSLPRSTRFSVYVAAVFIAWMLSGQLPWFSASDDDGLLTLELPSVRAYRSFEQNYLPYLDLSGQTQASRQVVVRAQTSGRVERTFFQKGEYVEAGDELVELDPASRPLELEEARTQLQKAQTEYTAIGSLARGGYRSELRLLEALSSLNSARVAEDRIRRDLENTKPLAPFSGSIASVSVERGDFLSLGNEIARLIDLDPIKVRVAVSEQDISSVTLGARVSGELIIGESFSGKVGTIAPASNSSTRTFEVEILIANRDGRWREGLTAQVRLPIGSRNAHLIPAALLSLSADGSIGVKVIEDGVVRFRAIELIGENDEGVWVQGLVDNSLIISVGHENVSDGMDVNMILDERFSSPDAQPSVNNPSSERPANEEQPTLLDKQGDSPP